MRELVQQSTGTVCETPNGICTVAPQPINSPCKCGRYIGQVAR
ncbi:hypothetical protein [Salipiger sp. PrR002]|nr:hypothetical protein [Salipiger sp. PrR002]